jgi:hypothetical protein
MAWADLATRAKAFEIAAGWDAVAHDGHRLREHLAVVHFRAGEYPIAALHINDGGYSSWYGTMTEAVEERLPFYKTTDWSDIATHGHHHHLVTRWVRYP